MRTFSCKVLAFNVISDLEPLNVRGWFWTGSGVKLGTNPAGTRVAGHWSNTGGDGQPQPDNREFRVTVSVSLATYC